MRLIDDPNERWFDEVLAPVARALEARGHDVLPCALDAGETYFETPTLPTMTAADFVRSDFQTRESFLRAVCDLWRSRNLDGIEPLIASLMLLGDAAGLDDVEADLGRQYAYALF